MNIRTSCKWPAMRQIPLRSPPCMATLVFGQSIAVRRPSFGTSPVCRQRIPALAPRPLSNRGVFFQPETAGSLRTAEFPWSAQRLSWNNPVRPRISGPKRDDRTLRKRTTGVLRREDVVTIQATEDMSRLPEMAQAPHRQRESTSTQELSCKEQLVTQADTERTQSSRQNYKAQVCQRQPVGNRFPSKPAARQDETWFICTL